MDLVTFLRFGGFKIVNFRRIEISDQKYFHLWVFKNMEILDYIPKYVRYEDGPKKSNVRFKVVFTFMVFTEASVTYLRKLAG